MASLVVNGVEKMSNGIEENGISSISEPLHNANKLLIHGGNIANWNRTKRKVTSSSADELSENITTTLKCSLPKDNNNLKNNKHSKTIRSVNSCYIERIQKDERAHLKISMKIFAFQPTPSLVKDSFFRALCELGVDSIETLLLSVPQNQDNEEQSFKKFNMLWEEMEELYDCGYVSTLGTCDLDKQQLEQLYNSARIKPEINQVNLESCCVMPKDLVEFSKHSDIQLLTHADPQDMLTEQKLHTILSDVTEDDNVESWKPIWALRYSALVKCRGVIKSKAYIVNCERREHGTLQQP